jgi:hypothetical protein
VVSAVMVAVMVMGLDVERTWGVDERLHRVGPAQLRAWGALRTQWRKGSAHSVIVALEEHLGKTTPAGPGNKGSRGRLEKALKCLRDDIGSGTVVRNLVRVRLGPGMHLGSERAERELDLRCVGIRQWEEFAKGLGQLPAFRLAAQPEEAQFATQRREPLRDHVTSGKWVTTREVCECCGGSGRLILAHRVVLIALWCNHL